ncbi:MAG: MFS transporter [Methanosarcinales archaeon]|nr:MFS transporter [Methanosarcinales archaeon]
MSGKTFLKIKKEMYILSFSRFFEDFGTGMMVALIPLYIAKLNSVYFQDVPVVVKVGIVMSIFGAVIALSQPFLGVLTDYLGKRKPLILFGLAGFAVISFLYARINLFESLIMLRIIEGLLVGAALPSLMGMLSDLSLPDTKGRVIGMHSTIRGIAFGLGPIFGGAVATYYSYTAGFYLCAVFGTLSLLLVSLFVKETHSRGKIDTPIKTSKNILIISATVFIMMLGTMIVVSLLPEFEGRLGASQFSLGIMISVFMLARLLFQIPIGTISDNFNKTKIIVLGLAVSSILIISLGYASSINELIFIRGLQGIAAAAVNTPLIALAAEIADGSNIGHSMGYIMSANAGGMAIGPLVGGLLAGYISFVTPFYLCAFLMLFSAVLIWIAFNELPGQHNVNINNPIRG